jgi:photosystem II stability/assembly factor-like uncharacterized protein
VWAIRLTAFVALAAASLWQLPATRADAIAPADVVAGTISGPGKEALARRLPVAVSFVSRDAGFLATAGGQLLSTSDGGESWRRAGPVARFVRLAFLTSREGFAVSAGGVLLETRDGGRSWRRLHSFPNGAGGGPSTGGLDFVDPAHGFVAASDGRIFRTADGGRHWTRLRFRCGFVLGGVAFLDPRHGLAVCGGEPATDMQAKQLYATTDGGTTWHRRAQTTKRRGGLPWIGFGDGLELLNPRVAYMSAARAGIYGTADSGRSWRTVLFTDDGYDVRDMSWLSPHSGFVVLSGSGLVATEDGGKSWRQLYPKRPGPPQGPVAFSSRRDGIGAGTGGFLGDPGAIIATTDGGTSWAARGALPHATAQQLVRVASRVWAVATPSTLRIPAQVRLLRSNDDGRHWRPVRTFRDSFASLSFQTGRIGFLAGSSGRIYRTTDGGRTWSLRSRGHTLASQAFVTPTMGFAIGAGRQPELLVTHDAGRRWQRLSISVAGFRPLTVDALAGHAWIAGGVCIPTGKVVPLKGPECKPHGGALLRTSDGGQHWELVRLPSVIFSGGIDFVTPKLGFVNDQFAGFYRTLDGGRTWRAIAGG